MQIFAQVEMGFSPILSLVSDGTRQVVQVGGWTGGIGTIPSTGMYIGSNGYVAAISDAINLKGNAGADGAGINIQVGTAILNTGTAIFSNSNGVTFGLSGSTITASVANAVQSSLVYSNSNNISFGIAGSTLTANASFAQSSFSLSAGTRNETISQLVFSNANGISFGLTGGTITGTVATNYQSIGAYLTTAMQSDAGSNFVGTNSALTGNGVSATINSSGVSLNFPAFLTTAQPPGAYLTTAMVSNRGSDFVQATAVFAGTNASGTIASDGISISVNTAGGGVAMKGSGTYTQNTGTVEFANSNGITFGLSNNGTMTAIHNGLTTAMQSNAGSNFLGTNSAITANGVSATINSSGVSLNFPAFLTTAQPVGAYLTTAALSSQTLAFTLSGNIATTNSSQILNGGYALAGGNGVTLQQSNNTVSISVATNYQSTGNYLTTARASNDAIGLNTALTANGVAWTVNSSGLSLNIPAFLTTADLSANSSKYIQNWKLTGNTAGTTSSAQGTDLWLAGGNGVTISGSSNTLSFSVATNYQSTGNYLTTAMVSNASTNFAGIGSAITNGTMTFGTGGLSLNLSNHLTTARASTDGIGLNTAQSNVTWTVNSSGLSLDARGYAGTGTSATNASITLNSNGLAISVANQAAGNVTFSGGASSAGLASIVFSNSNNISFGLSGSTITASASAQSNQNISLYALGNTTQNSSTVLNASNLSFNGLGALTWGYSNGSIQASAPAVSSLSATGQVSISVNGSTISIGVPNPTTKSGFSPYGDIPLMVTQVGQGSLIFDPENLPNVQFDRLVFLINNTNATNSSGSHTLSMWFGVYTRNASTLSLYSSASSSYGFTFSGTAGNYSLYSGMRGIILPMTATLTDNQYWLGFVSRTTSGGANGSFSNVVISNLNSNFVGFISSATNSTNQRTIGNGFYSVTTSGMPAAVAFSEIYGTGSDQFRFPIVHLASSTV